MTFTENGNRTSIYSVSGEVTAVGPVPWHAGEQRTRARLLGREDYVVFGVCYLGVCYLGVSQSQGQLFGRQLASAWARLPGRTDTATASKPAAASRVLERTLGLVELPDPRGPSSSYRRRRSLALPSEGEPKTSRPGRLAYPPRRRPGRPAGIALVAIGGRQPGTSGTGAAAPCGEGCRAPAVSPSQWCRTRAPKPGRRTGASPHHDHGSDSGVLGRGEAGRN